MPKHRNTVHLGCRPKIVFDRQFIAQFYPKLSWGFDQLIDEIDAQRAAKEKAEEKTVLAERQIRDQQREITRLKSKIAELQST